MMAKRTDAEEAHWSEELSAERPQLVRFCAQMTGGFDVAEDLAQETLAEAWCNADKLRDSRRWRPWLFGIARNVCLRWRRRQGRDMARLAYGNEPFDIDEVMTEAPTFTGPKNIETPLEQAALTAFLDRALAHLPPPTRVILLERYVDELAPAEIAARWGLSENATAVRLHRSRQALRRVLMTRLRAEAASYDLLPVRVATGTATRAAVCASESRRSTVSSIGKFGV